MSRAFDTLRMVAFLDQAVAAMESASPQGGKAIVEALKDAMDSMGFRIDWSTDADAEIEGPKKGGRMKGHLHRFTVGECFVHIFLPSPRFTAKEIEPLALKENLRQCLRSVPRVSGAKEEED